MTSPALESFIAKAITHTRDHAEPADCVHALAPFMFELIESATAFLGPQHYRSTPAAYSRNLVYDACGLTFSMAGETFAGAINAKDCTIIAASGRKMGIDASVQLTAEGYLSIASPVSWRTAATPFACHPASRTDLRGYDEFESRCCGGQAATIYRLAVVDWRGSIGRRISWANDIYP